MPNLFNLDLDTEKTRNAKYAFLAVDFEQARVLAERFDSSAGEVASHLNYRTIAGEIGGVPVLALSSGIGGPAVSLAVHELAALGVTTVVGCGTCGAIQDDIQEGDMVLASGGVRLDGASRDYAPIEYPAVSSYRTAVALVDAMSRQGKRFHIGLVAGTDTFYPGQERYDEQGKHVICELRGSLQEWKRLGVLAYDMETSTLLVVARTFGMRAASLRGVLVNRARSQHVEPSYVDRVRADVAEVVVEAMRSYIQQGEGE